MSRLCSLRKRPRVLLNWEIKMNSFIRSLSEALYVSKYPRVYDAIWELTGIVEINLRI